MRTGRHLSNVILCAAVLMLGACSSNNEYKQTFVSRDSNRELLLTSKVGMVRPGGLPQNILVHIFGQPDLKGAYELKTAEGNSKGTFIAGRDGDKQWIKFTPNGNDGTKEWTLKPSSAGYLEGDNTEWDLKRSTADVSYSGKLIGEDLQRNR